ncbi:MAG: hypothetical protein WC876_03725 [Candidatus Thermoplasmatota archaeon]|jgi:hypothetical protein
MKTLLVREAVGSSLLGTASFPGYTNIEIHKMAPMLRTSEDPLGLARCGFLDPTVPMEVNLAHASKIRSQLLNIRQREFFDTDNVKAEDMVKRRPSFGFIPPELFLNPNDKAIEALASNEGAFAEMAGILEAETPAGFWVEAAKENRYFRFLQQQIAFAGLLGVNLVAPPVPPATAELASSPDKQREVLNAATQVWDLARGSADVGLLYPLHLHPNMLTEPDMLRSLVLNLRAAVLAGDNPYWAVHLSFIDPTQLSKTGDHIVGAKEFVKAVVQVARQAGMFVVASDVGPLGPAFLDLGVAFATYHSAMTPRVTYTAGGNASTEATYGKVLTLWGWQLLELAAVRRRGWMVEDTGLYPNMAPSHLRPGKANRYRIEFARPNNIAAAEALNRHLHIELTQKKHLNPGTTHLGKSRDKTVAAWAATN